MEVFKSVLFTMAFIIIYNVPTYANTINIIADESVVGNIICEVLDENENKFEDGSVFELIDRSAIIVAETVSKDSIIVFENIPFGSYLIKSKNPEYSDKVFPVSVDKSHLDVQHIPKVLSITDSVSSKFGENYLNNLIPEYKIDNKESKNDSGDDYKPSDYTFNSSDKVNEVIRGKGIQLSTLNKLLLIILCSLVAFYLQKRRYKSV